MAQPTLTHAGSAVRDSARPWRVIGMLLLLALVGAFGNAWDLFWHITIGRDSFWVPPHTMMYAAIALSGLIALAFDTALLIQVHDRHDGLTGNAAEACNVLVGLTIMITFPLACP